MKPKLFLFLAACNVIWSLHPLLGKWALQDFSPTEVAILRYGSAGLSYFLLSLFFLRKRKAYAIPKTKKDTVLMFLLGFCPFAVSPILQLTGLSLSQSIDNAIVIAMEPLMTVLMVWIFLREGMTLSQGFAFLVAMIGFLLVSKFDPSSRTPFGNAQFLGFALMLTSLIGESVYVVCGRILSRTHEAISLYGTAILCGVTCLLFYGAWMGELPDLGAFSLRSFLAVAYLGPIGTTLSYMLWMVLIKDAPVPSLALTLFIQPVFGSIWGTLWLGESFDLKQTFGAILILAAVGFQSALEVRAYKKSVRR